LRYYHKAVSSLREAIKFNPRSADAFYNLAAAYTHLGEKWKALQELKSAVELNPTLAAEAPKDEDFKVLRLDPEFLKIVEQRSIFSYQ